jgi:uncharacterized repeat protein (TIGR03803 family)
MRNHENSALRAVLAVTACLILASSVLASAQTEHVLYSFAGLASGGTDGDSPIAGVVSDAAGNLYGTTWYGGTGGCTFTIPGCGTVYELSPPSVAGNPWTESVLYSFTGGADGAFPTTGVTFDAAGNLYGATYNQTGSILYKLSPPAIQGGAWTETTIGNLTNGNSIMGSFAIDVAGNLFCTGGSSNNEGFIFEVSPPATQGGSWTLQTIYTFKSTLKNDGSLPDGPLVITKSGAIYGTTAYGGLGTTCSGTGCGTVFRLLPPSSQGGHWSENVLYRFTGGVDGGHPFSSGVLFDKHGKLYGTAAYGGSTGDGVVFELSPPAVQGGAWTETTLHSFDRNVDAFRPLNNVVMDQKGRLFGTTWFSSSGYGAVFELIPPATQSGVWTESLYNFTGGTDGGSPNSLILSNKFDWLYGTAAGGGKGACACGTIFKLTP